MRILLAHNQFTVTGGAEVFYHEIDRLLRSRGHEVALFSCYEDGLEEPGSELFPVVPGFRELGMAGKIARLTFTAPPRSDAGSPASGLMPSTPSVAG